MRPSSGVPTTGVWTTLASNSVNRVYHSTSILLPDGRVLHAGSGDSGPDQRTGELFSPPYLFKGARPAIESSPAQVGYGASFSLTTPDAAEITKVSFIRLGSTTHAFDMNTRFQWLSFEKQAGGLTIRAPASRNRTPPGHYLLFILKNRRAALVVSKIIQIGDGLGSEPPPDPPPSSFTLSATGRTDPTSQFMDLAWSGASGDSVDIYLNGAFRRAGRNTGHATLVKNFTGAATYNLKVCELRATVCSNAASVSFEGTSAPAIALSVTGRADATHRYMDLTWSGARGTSVDLYLNDQLRRTASNTGHTTITINSTAAATYQLKVCETGSTTCSNVATTQF